VVNEPLEERLGLKTKQIIVSEGRVTGVTAGEEMFQADKVISTIPTPILSGLVRSVDPGYADALNRIRYMNAMCTVLALAEPLSDIYWTNVADPEFDFGGVIEQTNFVPADRYDGMHLAYLSRYLLSDNPLWTMEDDELLDRQYDQLMEELRKLEAAQIVELFDPGEKLAGVRLTVDTEDEVSLEILGSATEWSGTALGRAVRSLLPEIQDRIGSVEGWDAWAGGPEKE